MSSHADTIRLAINAAGAEGHLVAGAWDALDELLAENQQLREALERLRAIRRTRPLLDEDFALALGEALAGDAE